MKVKTVIAVLVFTFVLITSFACFAADPIQLPNPQMEGGKPLMLA
jgi:hypothetical protein